MSQTTSLLGSAASDAEDASQDLQSPYFHTAETRAYKSARRHRILRLCTGGLYVILIATVALVMYYMFHYQPERHVVAWVVSACCVLLSVPLTILDQCQHITYYVRPAVQRYYVRVLGMVIIYSIESFLALTLKSVRATTWLAASCLLTCHSDALVAQLTRLHYRLSPTPPGRLQVAVPIMALRDAYEAYTIYNAYHLLRELIADGSDDQLLHAQYKFAAVQASKAGKPLHSVEAARSALQFVTPHTCGCLRWTLGKRFLAQSKFGILQYVLVKLVGLTAQLATMAVGKWGEGKFRPSEAYVYVTVLVNFSQVWAMACLVSFYTVMSNELGGRNLYPKGKLLAIKAVVFFMFYQQLFISFCVYMGWIHSTLDWSVEDIANGLGNFTVTMEMVIFALVHMKVFSVRDFLPRTDEQGHCQVPAAPYTIAEHAVTEPQPVAQPMPVLAALWHAVNPQDVVQHTGKSARQIPRSALRRAEHITNSLDAEAAHVMTYAPEKYAL